MFFVGRKGQKKIGNATNRTFDASDSSPDAWRDVHHNFTSLSHALLG
jgi:hypothetical protein